ncbi:tetratricopeptide repeat protein [Roseomonas sp. CECT 9278]|uniref:tetratricopeptide repeat protein n=1 Tax=Roseomonas sp. CECT 9278 TaxID=2845823 RepID=UPI001E3BF006|nr:tetratricopeptide repeat protein [Roseomonas sp. CECT 9278]CAH0283213.1 Beta-barrel assembly-enhancing protease [Roseomonas sp. CECT 9278]
MPETDRPAPRLLHAADGLSLHMIPGEGAAGLVVLAPDAAAQAWAGRVAARLARPILVVRSADGGFPAASMAALLPHLAAAEAGRILVGLGTGAVAALDHSAMSRPKAVLAIAPRGDGLAPQPVAAGAALIAYDPGEATEAALAARAGALGVPMPHVGGALADVVLGGGALPDVIDALLAGDLPRAAMALRVTRLAAPRMRVGLATRLTAAGHESLAAAVTAAARRPAAAEPQTDARVRALQRLGRHADAVSVINAWIRRQPRQPLPRRRLAAANLAMGQRQRAVLALKAAAGLGSLPFALQARLVGLLRRMRRPDDAVQAAEAAVAALPGHAAAEALLGEALLAAGRKEDAAAAFARALAADPDHAAARHGRAVAADAGGADDGPGQGLAEWLATMAAEPAPEAEWHALIDLIEAQGRPAAALAAASMAAGAAPAPGLLARLAQLRESAGDVAGAEAAWRRATALAPHQPAAWLGLADLLDRQQRTAEAAKVATEAAMLLPAALQVVQRNAELLLAAQDPIRAEAAARAAVALDPQRDAAHLLLADALWRQHRGRDAVRAVEAGLVALPGASPLLLRLAFLHLMQNAPLPAAAAFREVTRQPQATPHAWLGLTDALWRAERVEEAEAAAREGVAAHPRNVELRTRLGQLLLAGGDAEAARAALAEVVAEDPASEVVQLAMADALWRQGRRAEALAAAREVAEAAPDQPAVASRLGHLLLENGDIEDAVAQFQRAIALQPDLVPAWTGLCDAERTRKRIKPAIEAYRRAEALGMDRMTRRLLRFRLFGEMEE